MTDIDLKELEKLFPKKEYKLNEKITIEISPLSLEDLPKVANAFASVTSLIGQKKTIQEIVTLAIAEILTLAKYCLNIPTKYVPIEKVPDILTIMVEQNMSEDIVKKWTALIEQVQRELGQGKEKKGELSQK